MSVPIHIRCWNNLRFLYISCADASEFFLSYLFGGTRVIFSYFMVYLSRFISFVWFLPGSAERLSVVKMCIIILYLFPLLCFSTSKSALRVGCIFLDCVEFARI